MWPRLYHQHGRCALNCCLRFLICCFKIPLRVTQVRSFIRSFIKMNVERVANVQQVCNDVLQLLLLAFAAGSTSSTMK
jgi:hypothetical protein